MGHWIVFALSLFHVSATIWITVAGARAAFRHPMTRPDPRDPPDLPFHPLVVIAALLLVVVIVAVGVLAILEPTATMLMQQRQMLTLMRQFTT